MKSFYYKSCALTLVMFVTSLMPNGYNYDFFNYSDETVLIRGEGAGGRATSFKVKPKEFVRLILQIYEFKPCLHKYELYKEHIQLKGKHPKVKVNEGAFDNWYLSNQCYDANFVIIKSHTTGKFHREKGEGIGLRSGKPARIVYL